MNKAQPSNPLREVAVTPYPASAGSLKQFFTACGWIPGPSIIVSWLFLRGLGFVYLFAFASWATQIVGLIGTNGILPINAALTQLEPYPALQKYWLYPTLFWLDASDAALHGVCHAGIAAACLLIFNIFTRVMLVACYVLYLAIVVAGQDFTSFQWDIFLLESGFLAIFLTWGSAITVFLYRLLIARFMFMGGIVKIASGDPTWRNLTALDYHYQTQPLPSPLAYYLHFFPEWWHKFCVSGVFFIELLVPLFVFMPRPFRLFAAGSFIILQSTIMLTGNYNFFNVLTVLLCLFLFEDQDIAKYVPETLRYRMLQHYRPPGPIATACAGLWAAAVVAFLSVHFVIAQTRELPSKSLLALLRATAAFSVINNYGPFSVMTTERHEIVIEGSEDGQHWREYVFEYKPDALDKELSWNIPHQPRLDWQMWFAAMDQLQRGGWFDSFMHHLQQGTPEVLALLAYNPFPEHPPAHLHALLYRYSFEQPKLRAKTGHVWRREYLRVYWPPEG